MEWMIENTDAFLYGGAGLLLLLFYIRCKKKIRSFLLGSISGLSTLLLLHFYGGVIGFTPTICLFNLIISALLGIPGVILLYLAQTFL